LHLLRAGAERGRTRWLCLGQDLGGDATATAFHCAQLEPILAALGAPGYRAAQLEGGVAAERLQLAAFALGVGASGLTFLDDDVSAFFGTLAAPMLTVAVGVPAYRARPGSARPSCHTLAWRNADHAGRLPPPCPHIPPAVGDTGSPLLAAQVGRIHKPLRLLVWPWCRDRQRCPVQDLAMPAVVIVALSGAR
jgi:hypothetical protein